MQLFTGLEQHNVGKSTDVIFLCMCKGKYFNVSQLMQTKALFWLCAFEAGLAAPLSIRQQCKDNKNPHRGNRDHKQSFCPATESAVVSFHSAYEWQHFPASLFL